jgi:hypothetical protein
MTSNGSQEVERVRQARCILEKIRGRLLRPSFQALDASSADLNLAVECLRQLDISLKSPIWQGLTRRKLEREVVALRAAVRSVEDLLQSAGKFYAGLARLMAPDETPAHYTAAGTSGAPARAGCGRVALHG